MAVNKTFPYDDPDSGLNVISKLDELMLKYYRDRSGTLNVEAFEVGQSLQFYFATYSAAVINQSVDTQKVVLPDDGIVIKGLEAPVVLLLENTFYQNNFQSIIGSMLSETARINTARYHKDPTMIYALQLCKWEYLSLIAALVGGTKAQRDMDLEMREYTALELKTAMELMRKLMPKEVVKNG